MFDRQTEVCNTASCVTASENCPDIPQISLRSLPAPFAEKSHNYKQGTWAPKVGTPAS